MLCILIGLGRWCLYRVMKMNMDTEMNGHHNGSTSGHVDRDLYFLLRIMSCRLLWCCIAVHMDRGVWTWHSFPFHLRWRWCSCYIFNMNISLLGSFNWENNKNRNQTQEAMNIVFFFRETINGENPMTSSEIESTPNRKSQNSNMISQ